MIAIHTSGEDVEEKHKVDSTSSMDVVPSNTVAREVDTKLKSNEKNFNRLDDLISRRLQETSDTRTAPGSRLLIPARAE